jgi:NitT/TauT family transport system substrate-binding protein
MKHWKMGLVAVLLGATGWAAAGWAQSGGGNAETKQVVKVGVTGRPDQASLVLALHRGYWDKQGLDVQFIQSGAAAQDATSALAANQIQVTAGSPSAGLFNALNRGINIRMVADWSHIGTAEDSTFSISVRSDLIDSGAVKSPADLKGRNIGAGPVKGGINDLFLSLVMAKGNLSPSEINAEFIPFPDGIAAMASKKLDAAMLIEPMVTQATAQGIAKLFITMGAVDPGAQVAIVFYSPDFAANKDAATKFMIGYLQGVRDYHDAFVEHKDQDAAIGILTQNLSLKDPNIWKNSKPGNIDLNGKFNVASIKKQAAFYKQEGLVDGPIPDVDKYVDTSFTDAAVKVIGTR